MSLEPQLEDNCLSSTVATKDVIEVQCGHAMRRRRHLSLKGNDASQTVRAAGDIDRLAKPEQTVIGVTII